MKVLIKFVCLLALLSAFMALGADTTRAAEYSAPGDEFWDDGFTLPNVSGTVSAIATDGAKVYVGGAFTYADGFVANNIALWDGTQTLTLGAGISGCNGMSCSPNVQALAAQGGKLYVGGNFTAANGLDVNNLAMWDGSQWFDVGGGVDGVVNAIAVDGSDVYVAGKFETAGNVTVHNIARWDGTQWHALGAGISGANANVNALALQNGSVYVGGVFSQAGDVNTPNIARWDGAAWHALGDGLAGEMARALTFNAGTLYVGGKFVGGCLAEWDGSSWTVSDYWCGNVSNVDAWINALVVWDGNLYGLLCAPRQHQNVLVWLDGNTWNFGIVGGDNPNASLGAGDFVYVGGQGIRAWDGQNWLDLFNANPKGLDGPAHALAVDGNSIYVGGVFTAAGSVAARNIARWDGASWHALGDGLDGAVLAAALYDGALYVGGDFTHAGALEANHIARWDGASWHALGDGVDGRVSAIAFNGDQLYVGGTFAHAGGANANHIAKWDGAAWTAVGHGVNGNVFALVASKGSVYVGGQFDRAGATAAKNIARYDGRRWSALGAGVNKAVMALETDGRKIFVGGSFTKAGGKSIQYLARWNGKDWGAVGGGVNAPVAALDLQDGALFVGGNFSQAGKISAHGIAKWNGRAWSALGSGANAAVYALTHRGADVIVGGSFTQTGDKSAGRFGIWHDPTPSRVTLLKPDDGKTVVKQKVNLDWSDSPGATGYILQIRNAAASPKIILEQTTGASEFQTPALKRGDVYAWRVQACAVINGNNYCSAWTASQKFKIKP